MSVIRLLFWPLAALWSTATLVVRFVGNFVRLLYMLGTIARIILDFCIYVCARALRLLLSFDGRLRHRKNPCSYEDWLDAAEEEFAALEDWRHDPNSNEYDGEWLQSEQQYLRRIMRDSNFGQMEFVLRGAVSRHHCRLDNPRLTAVTPLGTKYCIESYFDDVEAALRSIATNDEWSQERRLSFFEMAGLSLGRTALCLSGGGALAMAHIGVVKALIEHNVMPNVVSGTSGGSIIAGYIAIKKDEELLAQVKKGDIAGRHGAFLYPIPKAMWHYVVHGQAMKNDEFEGVLRKHYGTETFASAFLRTGRHVSITVTKVAGAGAKQKQTAFLLNHITSPNVLIWSAVAASCALPGLLKPVALMMRPTSFLDAFSHSMVGQDELPAYPAGVTWRDGSILADIPLTQMRRLFAVNQYIVSQTNPHVRPFARRPVSDQRTIVEDVEEYALDGMKRRVMRLAKSGLFPDILGQDVSGIFIQTYTATTEDTISIVPRLTPFDTFKMMSMPTEDDIKRYTILGERATWPKLATIHHRLRIELVIAEILDNLRQTSSAPDEPEFAPLLNKYKSPDEFSKRGMLDDVRSRFNLDDSMAGGRSRTSSRPRQRAVLRRNETMPEAASGVVLPVQEPRMFLDGAGRDLQIPRRRSSSFSSTARLVESSPIPGAAEETHEFEETTFTKPVWCSYCNQFIYGVYKQGKQCLLCAVTVHHGCADMVTTPCISVSTSHDSPSLDLHSAPDLHPPPRPTSTPALTSPFAPSSTPPLPPELDQFN